MRGVAQQGDASFGMFCSTLHRWPVAQRPEPPGGNGPDQILQIAACRRQPTLQLGSVGSISTVVPKLRVANKLPVDDGDHVQQLATAHRVVHHMEVAPQPGGNHLRPQVLRQFGLRHHGPKRQMPGDAR